MSGSRKGPGIRLHLLPQRPFIRAAPGRNKRPWFPLECDKAGQLYPAPSAPDEPRCGATHFGFDRQADCRSQSTSTRQTACCAPRPKVRLAQPAQRRAPALTFTVLNQDCLELWLSLQFLGFHKLCASRII
jgi:hypothetical protein